MMKRTTTISKRILCQLNEPFDSPEH